MPNWLGATAAFLWEWFRLATVGGSVVVKIAKGIGVAVAVILFGISHSFDVRTHISFLAGQNGGAEMAFSFEPSLGVLTLIAIGGVWLAVAFAATWTQFQSVVVGSELEFDAQERVWRLSVRNTGWKEVEIPVWVMEIADDKGPLRDRGRNALPLELGWMHSPAGRPQLSKGVPFKVNILHGGADVRYDTGGWEGTYTAAGIAGKSVEVGKVYTTTGNKIWIGLHIGSPKTFRWFSIQADDEPGDLKTQAGPPPFIKAEPTFRSRLVGIIQAVCSWVDAGYANWQKAGQQRRRNRSR
jgi:hypothetical protein